MTESHAKRTAFYLLVATLSLMCLVIPHLRDSDAAVLTPSQLIARGVNGFGPGAPILLFLEGALLWSLSGGVPWKMGLASVAFLPLWTAIDIAMDPTSHNLWPFEVLFYPFVAGPVFLGAEIAKRRASRGQGTGGM